MSFIVKIIIIVLLISALGLWFACKQAPILEEEGAIEHEIWSDPEIKRILYQKEMILANSKPKVIFKNNGPTVIYDKITRVKLDCLDKLMKDRITLIKSGKKEEDE